MLGAQGQGGVGGSTCRHGLAFAFEPPGQLLCRQITQGGRQGGDGHLTQTALVVACGKLHQAQPVFRQGGNAFEHGSDGLECAGLACIAVILTPDNTQHFPFAQGYTHQAAAWQQLFAVIAQQFAGSADGAMGGRMDGDKKQGHGMQ
ncbi:hypothetical protein D3C72_1563290 [compost metagenome]